MLSWESENGEYSHLTSVFSMHSTCCLGRIRTAFWSTNFRCILVEWFVVHSGRMICGAFWSKIEILSRIWTAAPLAAQQISSAAIPTFYTAINYNIYTCVYSLWPEKMTVWCTVYMYSICLQPVNSCQMHECTVFIFSKSAGQFSDHSESMCMTSSHWGSKAWYYCKCMIVFPYTHLQLAPLWMETRQYVTIVFLNCMHGF